MTLANFHQSRLVVQKQINPFFFFCKTVELLLSGCKWKRQASVLSGSTTLPTIKPFLKSNWAALSPAEEPLASKNLFISGFFK